MDSISINTFEDIHHTCLMFGLKKAYMRYPSLAHNPLASPPPFMRNPRLKRIFIGSWINPVQVQYYRKEITVLYDEVRISKEDAINFSKAVVEEYFKARHPFAEHTWNGNLFTAPEKVVSEII